MGDEVEIDRRCSSSSSTTLRRSSDCCCCTWRGESRPTHRAEDLCGAHAGDIRLPVLCNVGQDVDHAVHARCCIIDNFIEHPRSHIVLDRLVRRIVAPALDRAHRHVEAVGALPVRQASDDHEFGEPDI